MPPTSPPYPPPVIGLIPAAGHARRLGPLPCSKEILPVGFRESGSEPRRPKVACHYLLDHLRAGGITDALMILRNGKWDIPACLGGGEAGGVRLGYLVTDTTPGVPYTLDRAYPFVRHARVALGFPDILFDAQAAYARLLTVQMDTGADVVLGLFPADRPQASDMVETEGPAVTRVVVKPPNTHLSETWGIAVWAPSFTQFLHDFVNAPSTSARAAELHVGHVLQAAIETGMRVCGQRVADAPFLDIGTPENLARAVARETQPRAT